MGAAKEIAKERSHGDEEESQMEMGYSLQWVSHSETRARFPGMESGTPRLF